MFVRSSIHLETARAVATDDRRSSAAGEGMSAPARELAQRLSGTEEVLLLWHPDSDQVELSVRDVATGAGFHLDVAPDSAIDAFYHPYAYVARREIADRVVPAVPTTLDG
jgi:hypothetical protein